MIPGDTFCSAASLSAAANGFAAPTHGDPFRVNGQVLAALGNCCFSCHEDATMNGDVRLDNPDSPTLNGQLDLPNCVQERIYFDKMPLKKKGRPADSGRNLPAGWLAKELGAHNAPSHEDELGMPEYAKLFSGKCKDVPGFTPDRRWLIGEFFFDAKTNRLLEHAGQRDIDGKRHRVIGENGVSGKRIPPGIRPNC